MLRRFTKHRLSRTCRLWCQLCLNGTWQCHLKIPCSFSAFSVTREAAAQQHVDMVALQQDGLEHLSTEHQQMRTWAPPACSYCRAWCPLSHELLVHKVVRASTEVASRFEGTRVLKGALCLDSTASFKVLANMDSARDVCCGLSAREK